MICRLCLQNSNNCFHLFESEGLSLKAAIVISKYFNFQVDENDADSLYVCRSCWAITDNFHNLYVFVENSQSEFVIILENDTKNKENNFLNEECFKYEDDSLEGENCVDNDCLLTTKTFQDNHSSISNEILDQKNTETRKINENKLGPKNNFNLENSEILKKTRSKTKLDKIQSKGNISKQENFEEERNTRRGRPVKKKKGKTIELIESKCKSEKITNEIVSDEEISKMKKITCQICMIEIPTFLDLKKHFIEIHDEDGYAICCDKKFYKRYKFVHHLKMHVNPNEYKCPHCEKQFSSKKYITHHIKNVHTKTEKIRNFTCETCSKSFVQKGALVRHVLTHVPDNEKLFHCENCEKSFPTEGVLRTHKKTVHEGRYGGICALCGKKYQNPQDLKRHCLEHEGITEPKAQCDICGDWLANKYKLKRHMIKHNTAHLEHKCPHCDKLSPNEIALKSHIKFTHDDSNKIHQCSICDKAFRRRIDLKEHMTVHTGEHLYTCPHCPRTFTHHSNLHHHRKKMHRKEFDEERLKRGMKKIPWIRTVELKKTE